MVTLNGTEYDGSLLITQDNNNLGNEIDLTKSYDYVEVNGYLFMMDGAGLLAPTSYAVVTDVAANTTGTTARVYETDLLLTTGETVTVNAKVANDVPVVGKMYTYSVDNAGNYVLTQVVNDASYEGNTSIYTVQEAYKTGARLANSTGNYGVSNAYGVDVADNQFFRWAAGDNTKYYIKDDAVLFVFYNNAEDEYYDVISGAELKAADLAATDVKWAFTGANKQASGQVMVELGYIAIPHDVDEVSYDAYIVANPNRTIEKDGNGDFYITVDAVLPGGESVTFESKHCEAQNDPLLVELYDLVKSDDPNHYIHKITVLNDKIVHVDPAVRLTQRIVAQAYDVNTKSFVAKNGVTYVVDEDTNVYSLHGLDLTAINANDPVWVVADTPVNDVAVLKTLVYTD